MKRVLWLFVIILLCAVVVTLRRISVQADEESTQAARQTNVQEQNLQQIFIKYEQVRLDTARVATEVLRTGRVSFNTPSMTFDLALAPHDMRASNYRSTEIGDDWQESTVASGVVRTYKGEVLGRPDAQARFTIDDGFFEGAIITPEERYFIEPMSRYSATADPSDFIFYKGSDVIENSTTACAVTSAEQVNNALDAVALYGSYATAVTAPQPEAATATTATLRQVEIATEADYEYVTALGGAAAANNEIMSIMNQVDGVYQRELNLTFKIVYQSAWATPGDPYTATDLVGIVNQFTNYWNANRTAIKRDMAHLWTGKNVGGSGVSWQGTTCLKPEVAYGVSPRVTSIPQKYIITAHEIGHSFNATHTSDATCQNMIMTPIAGPNSSLTFCQFSRNQINTFVNANASCLAAVQTGAAPALSAFRLSAPVVPGCKNVTGTVTLSAPAPADGVVVTLSDNIAATRVPVSVTVPAGATSKTFSITTVPVTASQAGSVTATLGAVTKSAALTVRPIGVLSVVLSPNPVVGPNTVTGTVTLECAAPANGIAVALASSNTAVAAPTASRITIPAGSASGKFTVRTTDVSASGSAIIKATANSITKSRTLTVN